MKILKSHIILYCLLYLVSNSFGQDIITIQANKISKLPDKEFYDVYQDSKLNYWFISNTGLYQFDGISYLNYSDPNNTQKALFNILEDDLGRIWVMSLNGEFYYVKDNILILAHKVENLSTGHLDFDVFNNKIFYKISNVKGIFVYNLDSKKTSKIDTGYKTVSNEFIVYNKKIYNKDKDNKLAVIDAITLKKDSVLFNPEKRPSDYFFKKAKQLCFVIIHYSLGEKEFYILNNSDFTKVDLPKFLIENDINKIDKDRKGNLIFSTPKGVLIGEVKNNKLINCKQYLQDVFVTGTIEDVYGNYIATSIYDGVIFFDPSLTNRFTKNNSFLKSNDLTAIKYANNTLRVGDELGNFYKANLTSNFKDYSYKKYSRSIRKLYHFNSIKSSAIVSEKETYLTCKDSVNQTLFSAIKEVKQIKPNKLLLCSSYGAGVYSYPELKKIDTLHKKRTYSGVFVKKDSTYQIASVDGVFEIKQNKKSPLYYNNSKFYARQLLNGQKYIWYLKKNGQLFYSNSDTIFSTQHKKIKAIKCIDSTLYFLRDNSIHSLNESNLSSKSIYQLNPFLLETKIKDFDIYNNTLYLATNKGLIVKRINASEIIKTNAKTYLKQLVVNNDTLSLHRNTFAFNENNLTLYFRNKDALGELKYNYKYKFKNVESDWANKSTLKTPLRFYNLKADNYTLLFKTINKETKLEDIYSYSFIINPPFWKRPLFIITVSFLILFILGLFVKQKINNLRTKQQLVLDKVTLEKQYHKSELKALKSQMNPHFMFNAMNSIQTLILEGNKDKAYDYLTKLSSLIRNNLNISGKTFIYLEDELNLLKTYLELEKLRFKKEFNYVIHPLENDDLYDVKIPAMILQPFVENAIKHGLLNKDGVKKIDINFRKQNAVLICSITDNGIGRKAAQKLKNHKSFALDSIQKRFTLLSRFYNKELGFNFVDLEENNIATGTRVIIKIPFTIDE